MQAKSGSYMALLDVLEATGQTGAREILVSDDKSSEKLLSLKLQLMKDIVSVNELFPDLSKREARHHLGKESLKKELKKLKTDSPQIHLYDYVTTPTAKYSKRSISNCIRLSPESLKGRCNTVYFVNGGVSEGDLMAIVGEKIYEYADAGYSSSKAIFVYLRSNVNWFQIQKNAKNKTQELFLLRWEAPLFVVEEYSNPKSIRIYDFNLRMNAQDCLSEEEFVTKVLSNETSRVLCLCDTAGMGKSWLLRSLAKKVQQNVSHKNIIVLFPKFSEMIENFQKQNERKSMKAKNLLRTLIKFSVDSKLSRFLMYQYVIRKDIRLVVFLDGLDEISPDYFNTKPLFVRQLLENTKIVEKIIVSSRPIISDMEIFKVRPYYIVPMKKQEQIDSLVGHWSHNNSNCCEQRLTDFATECINVLEANVGFNCDVPEILKTPLTTKMFAEMYNVNAQTYANQGIGEESAPFSENAFNHKSIYEFYDKFFEHLLKQADNRSNYLTAHFYMKAALQHLFPDANLIEAGFMSSHKDQFNSVKGLGTLKREDNDNYKFMFAHQTFAEYFAARYFAGYRMDSNEMRSLSPNATVIGRFFVENILSTKWESRDDFGGFVDKGEKVTVQILSDRFHYSELLGFMNHILEKSNESDLKGVERTVGSLRKTMELEKAFVMAPCWNRYEQFRRHIKRRTFSTLMCSIDKGLTSVLKILKHIVSEFIQESDKTKLLIVPKGRIKPTNRESNAKMLFSWLKDNKQKESVAYFMNLIAEKASEEVAQELFNVFEICTKFCKGLKASDNTPLYRAI